MTYNEALEIQRVALEMADSAMRKLATRASDAAFDAATKAGVRAACRAMRDMPVPYFDAIRHNATRGSR